jgi:hypothetical protein
MISLCITVDTKYDSIPCIHYYTTVVKKLYDATYHSITVCATNIKNLDELSPRHRDYKDRDYESLVTTSSRHRYLPPFPLFPCLQTAPIWLCNGAPQRVLLPGQAHETRTTRWKPLFRCTYQREKWYQERFGTEHRKDDIRKYRYLGKRMRPYTTKLKAIA